MSRLLDNQFKNVDAEIALLGSLLLEGDLVKDTNLASEHFYAKSHQAIFETMKELDKNNEPTDIISVYTKLDERKIAEDVGGIGYLNKLSESVPSTANFNFYTKVVKEAWKMRSAVLAAKQMQSELINQNDYRAVDRMIDTLQEIDHDETEKDFNLQDKLQKTFEDMLKEKKGLTGADLGFTELNRMLDGAIEGEFLIVGARPSVGKTAFALNIGQNVAKEGAVGIFSLEMADESLLKRIISATGNINSMKMRQPTELFDVKDWDRASNAIAAVNDLNLKIWDKPAVTIDEIYKKSRQFKKLHPDKKVVIIIDYLQLVAGSPKHKGNRMQEISEISRHLKIMARELNVCVVALSQLSRAVEQRQDKRPMMSDLRESGQIEQDADTVLFLYRDDYYDKESEKKDIIEIIIGKQRNGPTGTVELAFVKEFNKFVDLEKRYSENSSATG